MYNDNRSGGFLASIPPVTRNLIIINVLLWLVEYLFHNFTGTLLRVGALHYVGSSLFNPIQIITYMFLHSPDTIVHVLFNMFTLWMFGCLMEKVWGSRRFFVFYMVCGIGAALIQEAVWALTWEHDYVAAIAKQNGLHYNEMKHIVHQAVLAGNADFLSAMAAFRNQMMTVGASGAIYGILLGFACVFPNMPLYIFFIPIPIKAKYMVIGYGVIELFLGVSGSMDSVAHFAHLGGMLFGLILILYWRKKGTLHGNGFV